MLLHAPEHAQNRLGRRDDVERGRDRRAGVEVGDPEFRSSKLPLGVGFFRNYLFHKISVQFYSLTGITTSGQSYKALYDHNLRL